jgi:superfamily I DNA/RNA helicase
MDNIASSLQLQRYFLTFNYRLPKTVAKVAELVSVNKQNLVETSRRNNGKTDFPDFPKPVIAKCSSREEQLDFIVKQIEKENLDDVGILVPNNDDVTEVFEYLNKKNFDVQVKITTAIAGDPFGRFRQIDTLDFTNPNNPSILTYHSSKGTQFENIFLPFAENGVERSPFYVAMTRTSRRLFITYQNRLTSLLDEIPKEYFDIK